MVILTFSFQSFDSLVDTIATSDELEQFLTHCDQRCIMLQERIEHSAVDVPCLAITS